MLPRIAVVILAKFGLMCKMRSRKVGVGLVFSIFGQDNAERTGSQLKVTVKTR